MSKKNFNKEDIKSLPVEFSFNKKISNLISSFKIRVMYAGPNRNGSYFSEETMRKMADTIKGVPVVGHYSEELGDFQGHGDLLITDDGEEVVGIQAYGFVPTDANVYSEVHLDNDGVSREYMVVDAYLWTGRFPELEVVKEGKSNQSMELNPNSMEFGDWKNIDDQYFMEVTNAEFNGLCILGKDVEPCFEGAGVDTMFSSNALVDSLEKMEKELSTDLYSYSLKEEEVNEMEDKKKLKEEVKEDEELEEVVEEEVEDKEETKTEETTEDKEDEIEDEESDEKEEDEDAEPTEEEIKALEEEGIEIIEDVEELAKELEKAEELAELENEEIDFEAQDEEDLEANDETVKEALEAIKIYKELREDFEELKAENESLKEKLNEYVQAEELEEKELVLESYKDTISEEAYAKFSKELPSIQKSQLEIELLKEGYNFLKSSRKSNSSAVASAGTGSKFESEDLGDSLANKLAKKEKEI